MASSASALLLPLGSASSGHRLSPKHHDVKLRGLLLHCSTSDSKPHPLSRTIKSDDDDDDDAYNLFMRRRSLISMVLGVPTTMLFNSSEASSAGLPPEDKPKLCDEACEKDLENVPMVSTESGLQYKDIKVGRGPSPPVGFQVAANYVAMVPSGQVFDSSLEKGQIYIFRVGSGQVIKGLDEGILSMKVGGKR